MRFDYHMHLEYGSYDEDYAEGFFRAAAERGVDEIGFSEHAHTFPEFEQLYYDDLILDDSFVGAFQRKWLKTNKFKYTLDEYFSFIEKLRKKHKVLAGIEVCNFQDQEAAAKILRAYPFDYIIGSVHFLRGWAYDTAAIKAEWDNHPLTDIYEWYAQEAEKLAAAGLYDALGHPFNIRLYRYFPDFDVTPYLARVARAMKAADMIVDLNTGTYYRYPIEEFSPYPDFMRMANACGLPIITTSDAHKPEDCACYNEEAVQYARSFGYREQIRFTGARGRERVALR
ncbi:histidinol-phosphatase [Selenomonas noxia]|uniref:histidinol-phosphatase n=3 Tax=Selenomonas noxia TaxID=135083 RepID=UPI00248AF784|nr:histidinol-phosphatase [Selenomonas noxia]